MGNSFSTFSNSFNAKSINDRLLNTLDVIASDVLFRAKLEDIIKLTNNSHCEKIIALSSDMIKHMNKRTLMYWSNRVANGRSPDSDKYKSWELKTGNIYWSHDKEDFHPDEKRQLCRSIANFYVMLSQLYISILSALDPVFVVNGVERSMFDKYRSNSPIPPDVKISSKGIFHKMYHALQYAFKTDKHVINPNYCSVHKNINSLMDISGVKELQGLYFDRWQINGSLYMSDKNTDLYNNDVLRLYEQFVPPAERTDYSQITRFSDIPVKNTSVNPLCANGALNQPVFLNPGNKKLFNLYDLNIIEMNKFANKKERALLAILNTIFTETDGVIEINPSLTDTKLKQLINDTRGHLVDLYVEGQAFFVNGVKIYANILKQENDYMDIDNPPPEGTFHDHSYKAIQTIENQPEYYNPLLLNIYNNSSEKDKPTSETTKDSSDQSTISANIGQSHQQEQQRQKQRSDQPLTEQQQEQQQQRQKQQQEQRQKQQEQQQEQRQKQQEQQRQKQQEQKPLEESQEQQLTTQQLEESQEQQLTTQQLEKLQKEDQPQPNQPLPTQQLEQSQKEDQPQPNKPLPTQQQPLPTQPNQPNELNQQQTEDQQKQRQQPEQRQQQEQDQREQQQDQREQQQAQEQRDQPPKDPQQQAQEQRQQQQLEQRQKQQQEHRQKQQQEQEQRQKQQQEQRQKQQQDQQEQEQRQKQQQDQVPQQKDQLPVTPIKPQLPVVPTEPKFNILAEMPVRQPIQNPTDDYNNILPNISVNPNIRRSYDSELNIPSLNRDNTKQQDTNPFSHLNLGSYTSMPNSGYVPENEMITTPIGLPPRQLIGGGRYSMFNADDAEVYRSIQYLDTL